MWKEDKKSLQKIVEFKDFVESMEFVNEVAKIAEQMNHHPSITIDYNKVTLKLTTHDKGGEVTEKDKQLAKKIDQIGQSASTGQSIEEIVMYSDGGSRGNPGPSASGYVLYDNSGVELAKGGKFLGITTNNQAEYNSLKVGLEHSKKLGAKKVSVYMDSMLVVRQLKGEWKVRHKDILPVYEEVKELADSFDEVLFNHVPREQNTAADAEVNRILDSQ